MRENEKKKEDIAKSGNEHKVYAVECVAVWVVHV